MSNDERELREVECQILDRRHLKFKLLERNANEAVQALLRCYGDAVRALKNGTIAKDSDHARWQTANEGFRGLAHCFRWTRQYCPRLIIVPSPPNDVLGDEALELLRWGVQYDPLFNWHTAYSRKVNGQRLVGARVDESSRSIVFQRNLTEDPRFFVSQFEARKAEDQGDCV